VALPKVIDPQTREAFAILRCQSCGLGHTAPQPADLAKYYGVSYHGSRHGFTANYADRRRMRWLGEVFAFKPGARLADVGCGDGTFLKLARSRGFSVSGTELNPKIARDEGLDVGITLEEIAERGPFDVITFWHTLEHMRDPVAMLRQARSLLSRDGVVLVAVPNAGSAQARAFGRNWFHLDVPRHLFHFTEHSLVRALSNVQLSVIRRWNQEAENGFFGWTQSALNAISREPNALYALLTGRKVAASSAIVSVATGSLITLATVPIELGAVARNSGGTLIVAARALGGPS
jgi:SAM-dependent methyltransferase